MHEINRFRRLPQALFHFVIDRASLFTDHRISGLPIRAKYKHFRTIWEHTFDNSPTDFILPHQSGGHRRMEWILCRVVESSCWLTHNIAPRRRYTLYTSRR